MSRSFPLDDVGALLSELVAVPSPSGAEEDCAALTADLMRAAGMDVERVGNSCIGALEGKSGGTVLFNSHHDTVPVGEGWESDPYDANWRGAGAERRLVARGSNDAKASVAAMLYAAARHARASERKGTLLLAITAQEETTNAGMGACLAHLGERGVELDAAVTGEPTGMRVVRAQSGLAVLEAHWPGVACHAAHVARVANDNALLKAARDLAGLPTHFELDPPHPLLGPSTLVATVLRAGKRHNAVPDLAVAEFDARLAPPHDAAECAAILREHLPHAEIRVRSERLRPVETAADHPVVAAALAATAPHTGTDEAIGSSTMSDMALLAGVPAVKCGPGQTKRSHVANEHVLLHEVESGAAAYTAMIPAILQAST